MYKFLNDNRGFYAVITGVVTLVVAVIMIASVAMPIVLNTHTADTMTCGTYLNNTCNNAWPVSAIAMWGIIPILLVVGVYQIIMGGK
jgi:hypothetical protein